MSLKVYRLKRYKHLSFNVLIGTEIVNIFFTGGFVGEENVTGVYSTTDKLKQDAIESNSLFNEDYYLAETIESKPIIPSIQDEVRSITDAMIMSNMQPNMDDVLANIIAGEQEEIPETENSKEIVESITNYQTAKSYLLRTFEDCNPENVKNKEALLVYATSKGVVFTNLK
jgi:hypothetical protein